MANTKSAKKMTRKIAKRTVVNRTRRSRMRTFVRKVEEAIATGDAATAAAALRTAEPEVMRAAQKGIVHRNTAARKVSRLATHPHCKVEISAIAVADAAPPRARRARAAIAVTPSRPRTARRVPGKPRPRRS